MSARPRIGVRRLGRPHPAAATAEARVLAVELDRRLGPVLLDLRVDGDRLGPWEPIRHAAWPAEIDALIDLDESFGGTLPPLTSLFARTVDPAAAEVRRRMLRHLGLLDRASFDDAALDTDLALTPTDLWLIATAARSVDVSDRHLAALANRSNADAGDLDAAFDAVVARMRTNDAIEQAADRELARVRAELAEARAALAERADELASERVRLHEALDRLDQRIAEAELARGT